MNREGKKCVLYPRVSTEMQVDGYSLEGQKNSLKRFADREEMEIVGIYEDAGKSGKSIEGRPAFKKMLSDIKNGLEIDYILVYKLSRFGRNAADILNSLEFVQSYGINLICIEEGIDSSQTSGKLLISVLSAVAEIERENIIEQTMNGRREKARQGGWNGGFAPYGYYLKDNQLLIEETEAEAIRIIFDKFANSDIGLGGVAKYLNLQGIKKIPRQNGTLETWSSHFIRLILDNPVYCGKIAYGRRTREKVKGTKNEYKQVHAEDYILEDGQHEGIISEELWQKVHAKRMATGIKQPSKIGKDRSHLLTGILKCPLCGSSMYTNKHAWTNKDGTYKEVYYYICGRNKQERGHHCDYKASLRKTDIEPLVIEAVKELVSDKYFAKEIEKRIGVQTDTTAIDKELANYESKLKEVDLNKARLEREIDNLPIDARFRERKIHDMTLRLDALYDTIVELEERIEDAKLRKSSIEMETITLDNIYKLMLNFGKLYDIISDEEKKSLITYLIKEIQIYPNGESEQPLKSIEFNFPIYRDGQEVRRLLWEKGNTVDPWCVSGNYTASETDNASSQLAASTDHITGNITKFGYDGNKLNKAAMFNSSGTKLGEESFTYDNANRVAANEYVYGTNSVKETREYVTTEDAANLDERVSNYNFAVNNSTVVSSTNSYDKFKRLKEKTITVGDNEVVKTYIYNKTWSSVTAHTMNNVRTHYYSRNHDNRMRVNAETDADAGYENYYSYDDYGQLTRENNGHYGKTILYTYDNIGNITKAQKYDYTTGTVSGTPTEDTYVYSTNYPDRLTSFNGKSITYDNNGCVKTYDGWTYSWHKGRLKFISKRTASSVSSTSRAFIGGTSRDYTFTYDAYGQRTLKKYTYFPGSIHPRDYMTSCTTAYEYDLHGRLLSDTRTLNYNDGTIITKKFVFIYEESEIVGAIFTNFGGTETYYYDKNPRGDVINILDNSGNIVVTYAYDAYGNCTLCYDTNSDLADSNPIRYRSYYYDKDTGLYYLNARYYNPQWRRFISPDDTAYLDIESVNGLNLYAYCGNDPINYADPSGNSVIASIFIGFAVSALVGWGLSEMFGDQIAGGIGSVGGGAVAILTGINLCAFGPWGIVAGVALMAVGGLTIAFGANEIVDGATGTNYIQNWFGWSDSVYNGVYMGLNIVSAFGSISGNIGMRFASNNILNAIVQEPSKINNYKLWQIKTFGKYTSAYTPGTLKRGAHIGQGYTLTHNQNASLGYIQWHPGGGHHGPLAYWKITSSFNKAARFYYLTGLSF